MVMKMNEIETLFLEGNIKALKNVKCSDCEGNILFSVYKDKKILDAPKGRRIKSGISIYCIGKCNTMKSHLDGYCPFWAEEIDDWVAFSNNLY
jgi:hypothetical protein